MFIFFWETFLLFSHYLHLFYLIVLYNNFYSLDFCLYKPSFQAAISLYLSKIFINNSLIYKVKLWTNEDKYATGYSEEEIKRNLKIALNIIKQFFSGNIIKDITKTALFKKYKNIKYLEVANKFERIQKLSQLSIWSKKI